jgi:hypothetical protein
LLLKQLEKIKMKESKNHHMNIITLLAVLDNVHAGYKNKDDDHVLRHVGKVGTATREDFEKKVLKALDSAISIADSCQ